MRIIHFVSGLTRNTCRNFVKACELSGLLRSAFQDEMSSSSSSSSSEELALEIEVPAKYNLPAIAAFLETNRIELNKLTDVPVLLNAANYWDIPLLLRLCAAFLIKEELLDEPVTFPTNATTLQRRQFIELMHPK